MPALAFGSHYSVFKERPGTHRYSRCWCRVSRRTVSDGLLRRRVSFGCRMDQGWPVRRVSHVIRHFRCRQRARGGKSDRFSGPCRGRLPRVGIVAGADWLPADALKSPKALTGLPGVSGVFPRPPAPTSPGLRRFPRCTPIGGMRRATRPSACHPVFEVNRLSAPYPLPFTRAAMRKRALPIELIDLPLFNHLMSWIFVTK